MTTIIRVLVFVLTVFFTSVNAQDFQGVATYKTHRSIDVKMDSTSNASVSKEMHTKMMEMMKKQFQKTFKLTFNKEESIYKQEESLDKPQVAMGGEFRVISVGGGGGSDVLYKNTKDQRYADYVDTYGKIFLVKDSIKKIDWKLESDTKYIGEYQCFKASYIKMVEVPKAFTSNDFDKKEDDKAEPEMEERHVTAWYTTEIPVNNGPDNYQGLPGLILEVHDGKLTIICSKIVLNPKEKIDIKEPTKGKEISEEKYNAIVNKKSKEMMERFKSRKSERGGDGFSITIGG